MYLRNLDKHGRDAEKNLDLRIRKTRRAIRSGLVKACEAKPYEHVSVADICRVSMVSRTTFYDHYTGKDALLAEVVAFSSSRTSLPRSRACGVGRAVTLGRSRVTWPTSTRATGAP